MRNEKLSISEAFMLMRRLSGDLVVATNQIEDLEQEINRLKFTIKNKERIIQDKNDEIAMLKHNMNKEGVFNN